MPLFRLSLWAMIRLYVWDFVQCRHWWRASHTDADINRRDECSTVCRLIFRGDPCIILGSDILSVSMSAPRYPSEMKNPTQCHVIVLWTRSTGAFQSHPRWNECPCTQQKSISIINFFTSVSCLWNWKINGRFCSISFIWNPIPTVCQDRCFWSREVNFFSWKPSEVHLLDCLCSFTAEFQMLLSVIIAVQLSSGNWWFTALLFVTNTNWVMFTK